MERLKKVFGFSVEEDPLKKEIEEMRKAAKMALKEAEKADKLAKKKGERRGKERRGSKLLDCFKNFKRGERPVKSPDEGSGLSMTVEELESIFSEFER
ncbi:MAG: hypothetical protein NZ954_00360 [Thermofilaceae archaeon]|nr:hypothetical protein [Thermofilaceae archaeon]MCX8180368.1 hypothetical protein [Thermofilaceae archaeon]MDW8003903.1 hypothetical protein [Thermofilaceae archaeon]